jgi:glycosyltransferase involved in cell wall biosynthesis
MSTPEKQASEKQKTTVLFGMDGLHGGGAEKVLVNILHKLDRTRFAPELFLFTKCGVHLGNLPPDVKVHYLYNDPENYHGLAKFFRLALRSAAIRLLKRRPALVRLFIRLPKTYDTGVSFCEGGNLLLFAGAPAKFRRRISWVHIDMSQHKFALSKDFFAETVKPFERIIFISTSSMEIFQKLFPAFPAAQMKCIRNPIEVEEILEKANAPCDYFDKSHKRTRIVSAGRFAQMKRFDRLILACKKLRDTGVEADVFILGFGKEKDALQKLIQEQKMEDCIKLVPYQENPYAWMKQADIFVSSSDYEGLPLVVTEAMILGLPIVATKTPGSIELLQNGKYGVLVDFSEHALCEGLKTLVQSQDSRNTLKNALDSALKNNLLPFRSSIHEIEQLLSENLSANVSNNAPR